MGESDQHRSGHAEPISDTARQLGEFLREQRRIARLSMRTLSSMAQISNPYLSQIERGLRRPSAEILQQLANALRISPETVYVRAGILDDDRAPLDLAAAILADPTLTDSQKRALGQVLRSFRAENAAHADGDDARRPPTKPRERPASRRSTGE